MNAYEYAIARTSAQVIRKNAPLTREEWALYYLLMESVERYREQGK